MKSGKLREYYVLRVDRHHKHSPDSWEEYFMGTDYSHAVDVFLEAWEADWFDYELVQRTDTVRRYRYGKTHLQDELGNPRG